MLFGDLYTMPYGETAIPQPGPRRYEESAEGGQRVVKAHFD